LGIANPAIRHTEAVRVIPALDLRGGSVVRLRQGDFARERAYTADPLALVRAYAEAGATRLHLVDLDAARGGAHNRELVRRIVAEAGVQVQVAGGVRSQADARRWLDVGAAAVVMGTTAVRRPDLLAEIAGRLPEQVLAALDVRGERPAVAGWLEMEAATVPEVLRRWDPLPLGGVVVTSIDRDGTLEGPALDVLREARAETRHPLAYSGGVGQLGDLAAVAAAGADAVILGKSLLEGRFELSDALAASS
jgi:phosphoribosylformimino-5-aminoimidazole carboxamide ribotide isomerase